MKTYDEISRNVLNRRDKYLNQQRAKKRQIINVTSVATCLVLVICIGFSYSDLSRIPGGVISPTYTTVNISDEADLITSTDTPTKNPNPTSKTEYTKQWTTTPTTVPTTHSGSENIAIPTTIVGTELYYEIDWEKKTTPGKFCAVMLKGKKSDFIGEYVYPFGPYEERATTRKATEVISDMQIEGREPNGTVHETVVDIFSLEGISEELAIGVRFPDDERIYTYVNSSYIPDTLGEFLDATDYDNTVTYSGAVLYPGNVFPVNNENYNDIKTYLLSDRGLRNITDADSEPTGNHIELFMHCRELGREFKYLCIWESGHISTNLIGYEYTFYVGQQAVADFLKNSYNITFEQINEITAETTTTTDPDDTTWLCGTENE